MKKLLVSISLGVAATVSLVGISPRADLKMSLFRSAHAASADSVAVQLSRLVLSKDSYSSMIKQVTQGMLRASGQPGDAQTQAKFEVVMVEALPYEEMLQLNTKIYSSRFKESELQDIVTFYKTPTGAKLAKELPKISGDVGLLIGTIISERLPALMKKHGLTH